MFQYLLFQLDKVLVLLLELLLKYFTYYPMLPALYILRPQLPESFHTLFPLPPTSCATSWSLASTLWYTSRSLLSNSSQTSRLQLLIVPSTNFYDCSCILSQEDKNLFHPAIFQLMLRFHIDYNLEINLHGCSTLFISWSEFLFWSFIGPFLVHFSYSCNIDLFTMSNLTS